MMEVLKMADLKASLCGELPNQNSVIPQEQLRDLLERRGIVEDPDIPNAKARLAEQELRRNMYHNTQVMLKHYRDIVWALECFPGEVAQELDQPLKDLDALLSVVDTQMALGNAKLEHRLLSIRKSRLLLDRINEALTVLRHKPGNGELMYMTTRQSIALAQVIPQYRYTEGIGRRRVLTPDEVLRLPNDDLLIIIRGQKILRAKKFDFTEHPYAKECERTSIQNYHSDHLPVKPQEPPEQSEPMAPGVTKPPEPVLADSEKLSANHEASPAPPIEPVPKAPPSSSQPTELPPKPARRPKTLYERSRPPADF